MRQRRRDSSLREQSPLADAKDSDAKAHNAVSEALSNPAGGFAAPAQRAVDKAGRAVEAARADDNQAALEQTADSLRDAEERLRQARAAAAQSPRHSGRP